MTQEFKEKREWKKEALWYLIHINKWKDSPYRQEREYAGYVKRFFFGDDEAWDLDSPVWKEKQERRKLPLSPTEYLIG